MPTEPKKVAQEIHARNLVLLGAFVPVFLKEPSEHAAGVETAVRTARLMAEVEGSLPVIVLADENGKSSRAHEKCGAGYSGDGAERCRVAILCRGSDESGGSG